MDEYLSEKEQIERIRHWWSDYGWYLIGGVAIGLLGLYGWRMFQDTVAVTEERAAAVYGELAAAVADDDRDALERSLQTLRSEFADSPYTAQGALLVARTVLVSDPGRAIDALRSVMDDADDAELAMIARLRLARVLAWQDRDDEALALLDVAEPGAFAARLNDIRGDILLARGDIDGARAAYTSALIMPGADSLDRNFLQMKLASVMAPQPGDAAAIELLPEVDLDAVAGELPASPAAGDPLPAAAETAVDSDPPAVQEAASAAESGDAEPSGDEAPTP